MIKQIYAVCFCAAILLGLVACTQKSSSVAGAYPPKAGPNSDIATGALGGAVIGGVTGAGIAAAAGSNPLVGGAIGAGVGAGLGTWVGYEKQQEQYKRLVAEGLRVIELGDIVEITIPSDKLFYPNEANLTYAGLPILADILSFINSYGPVTINVSAHGDTTGTLMHSLELTQMQAQAVMTYFWAHGKPLDQMNFYGMDHQEPIADQDTAKGEYFNRRIEIMFWRKQKSSVNAN